jgi:hypothetical protein
MTARRRLLKSSPHLVVLNFQMIERAPCRKIQPLAARAPASR